MTKDTYESNFKNKINKKINVAMKLIQIQKSKLKITI